MEEPGPEVYCASLFSKCDPDNTGEVRVSRILETLKDLQGQATHLEEADKECSDELHQEVKKMFDPFNSDPSITLIVFTEGITSYLEKVKMHLMSDAENYPSTSSPRSQYTRMKISRNYSSDSSLAPPTNSSPPSETVAFAESEYFKARVADYELRIQKLTEDITNLRSNLDAALEENSSLLQIQRDENEKSKREQNALGENLQRLESSIHEKDFLITALEERNKDLTERINHSSNEIASLQEELKEAISEIDERKSEIQKLVNLIASRDEMLIILKAESDSSISEWKRTEQDLHNQISEQRDMIQKLQEDFDDLKQEKFDLEATLIRLETEVENNKRSSSSILNIESTLNSLESSSTSSFADIGTEITATGEESFLSSHLHGKVQFSIETYEKFDAATQCDPSLPAKLSAKKVVFKNIRSNLCKLLFLLIAIFIFVLLGILAIFFTNFNVRCVPNSYFKSVEHFFQSCGSLEHEFVPII